MTRLEFRWGKRIGRTTTVLTSGVHALVGSDDVAADSLVRAVAGVARDKHTEVLVDGVRPLGNPSLRRCIGTLFRREEPPEASSVRSHLLTVLAVRGDPTTPEAVVEPFGLREVLPRPPASLSAREARAVALALALSMVRPKVLALFDPLSTGLERTVVVERLSALALSGAVVLCRTSSAMDASDMGATVLLVQEQRGKLWRTAPDLTPWFSSECLVTTDAPRQLSSALSGDPAVTSVSWDEGGAGGELSVTGPDAEGTALAILGAAARSGAALYSVRRAPADRASVAPPHARRRSP